MFICFFLILLIKKIKKNPPGTFVLTRLTSRYYDVGLRSSHFGSEQDGDLTFYIIFFFFLLYSYKMMNVHHWFFSFFCVYLIYEGDVN